METTDRVTFGKYYPSTHSSWAIRHLPHPHNYRAGLPSFHGRGAKGASVACGRGCRTRVESGSRIVDTAPTHREKGRCGMTWGAMWSSIFPRSYRLNCPPTGRESRLARMEAELRWYRERAIAEARAEAIIIRKHSTESEGG